MELIAMTISKRRSPFCCRNGGSFICLLCHRSLHPDLWHFTEELSCLLCPAFSEGACLVGSMLAHLVIDGYHLLGDDRAFKMRNVVSPSGRPFQEEGLLERRC